MEFQGCTVSSSGLGQGGWLLPCQVNGFLIHDSMEGNSSTYGCPYAGSKVGGMHPTSRVTLTEQKSLRTSVMSLVDLAVDFFSRISVILLVRFLFYFLKQIFCRFCSTMISLEPGNADSHMWWYKLQRRQTRAPFTMRKISTSKLDRCANQAS